MKSFAELAGFDSTTALMNLSRVSQKFTNRLEGSDSRYVTHPNTHLDHINILSRRECSFLLHPPILSD